jgi:hypothetical protein
MRVMLSKPTTKLQVYTLVVRTIEEFMELVFPEDKQASTPTPKTPTQIGMFDNADEQW